MTCIDFVMSKCTKAEQKQIEKLLTTKKDWMDKNELQLGKVYIFVVGFHIGFGKLNDDFNLDTLEYDDGQELQRLLSIYDDNLKILFEKGDIADLWGK